MVEKSLLKIHEGVALELVRKHLIENQGAVELSLDERSRYAASVAAWRLETKIQAETVPLILVAISGFPFEPVQIFIPEKSGLWHCPHVGEDGRLCLNPNQTSFSQRDSIALTDLLVNQARELLSEGMCDKNRHDFVDEFENYWARQSNAATRPIYSLIQPPYESKIVYYFDGQKFALFGETQNIIKQWLKNRYDNFAVKLYSSAFLWLNRPLFPEEYPDSNLALSRLLEAISPETRALLESILPDKEKTLPLIFGFQTNNGAALGGTILSAPKNAMRGFRNGKMPASLKAKRFLTPESCAPATVMKVNPQWIHSRGGEIANTAYFSKKVILIGIGSVGSGVAFQLAKAGVGSIHLIDPDVLAWENIARHMLGAEQVRTSKAASVRKLLSRQMPHLEVTMEHSTWQESFETDPGKWATADLVISTTADWTCEGPLNLCARKNLSFPATVFGWTEPHACAGHALLVHDLGGCLGCGMDNLGHFSPQAIKWPEQTTVREAACGSWFQPYGYLPLTFIQSVISQLSLDYLRGTIPNSEIRTWLGDVDAIKSLGGELTPEVAAFYGPGLFGSQLLRKSWPRNPSCHLCE